MLREFLGGGARDGAFDGVLRWVLVAALICGGAAVLWDYGFLDYLFEADTSRISFVIVAIFLGYSVYCLLSLMQMGREYRAVLAMEDHAGPSDPAADAAGGGRLVQGFLRDVAAKHVRDPDGDRGVLLQSLAASLRAPARNGAYAADLLYKLGMLGTVIGFIVMLGSMENLQAFDVDTLRKALQQMTGGMAVALLTTIAGLVCGMLLRVQFNIAEGLATRILQAVVRLTEVSFVPGLGRPAVAVAPTPLRVTGRPDV